MPIATEVRGDNQYASAGKFVGERKAIGCILVMSVEFILGFGEYIDAALKILAGFEM